MGAFIVAGVVLVAGLLFAVVQLFAAGMSDATGQGDGGAGATAIGAVIIAVIIAATHWMPSIGW